MSGDRAEDVRSRAREVGAVLRRAEQLAPCGVGGMDASGVVRMTLGADGLPSTIEVAAGWERALRPDQAAVAVAQAFADASGRRMAAWAEALAAAGFRPGAAAGAPPGVEEPTRPHVPPSGRTIDDVAEAMIAAVHRPTAAAAGVAGVGSVADGGLVLTLSPSIGVRCAVDPHWAGMQSAGTLTAAFGTALAAAHADLESSVRLARAASDDLDVLLADAFALLGAAAGGTGRT